MDMESTAVDSNDKYYEVNKTKEGFEHYGDVTSSFSLKSQDTQREI